MNELPTQQSSDNDSQRWEILLLVSSLLAGLLFGVAAYREVAMAPWRAYQDEYRSKLVANATDDRTRRAAETFEIRYYQAYLPALGRIDRCITCHIGIDDPAMKDVQQPLTAHPGNLLEHHPVDRFGCTICHGGRGRATEVREAHGEEPGRPAPMRRGEMLQVSCAKCHSEPGLPGVPIYNLSQKLFSSKGCRACHGFRGAKPALPVPAMHGPDLTDEAAKHNLEWQVKHFLDPEKVVPGSKMPNFQFTDEEATALACLMLSFDGESPPHSFVPSSAAVSGAAELPSLTLEQLGVDIDPKAAPGYVGSQTCLKCHATLHPGLPDIWQKSKMGHDAFVAVRDVPENNVCLPCHTTGFNPQTNVFVEPNVGCEACHGPGKEYVGFILAGKRDEHKARARSNVLQKDRCIHCHQAPHVAKEKHAEHMRRLAEKQSLFQNDTSEKDTELLALVDYLKRESGQTTHDPSGNSPNEFGVIVDHRAAPGHVGSESCLFCHKTLHADVAHHWRNSKKAHAFETIRSVPQREVCLPCHTTGYNPETRVFVEPNVGCEACHAPGRDYAFLLMQGKKAEHAKLAKEMGASTNRCVGCHHVHVGREKHVETIRSGKQNTIDKWEK